MTRRRKQLAAGAGLAAALAAGALAAFVLATTDETRESSGSESQPSVTAPASSQPEPATSEPGTEPTEPPAEEPPPATEPGGAGAGEPTFEGAPPPPPPERPGLVKGLYDEPAVYGSPYANFPLLRRLGTRAIRANLHWGGDELPVSRRRPARLHPDVPAFDWTVYDRAVTLAEQHGIDVYFSVYGTPGWANGGQGANVAPTRMKDLEDFVFVAATRYSGRFVTRGGVRLPAVQHWIAWNEPNNPFFLQPQFVRSGGGWRIQSAVDYARICNAVVRGVRRAAARAGAPRGLVACGVTAPRGNNVAGGARPSISPIPFMRAMKAAGARGFDAYAHHPYSGGPAEGPSTPPSRGAITLGNIEGLIAEVTRLWGDKRIWITEYGYETNPPDRAIGVAPDVQARYLREAWARAKQYERIDVFIWFLLYDEQRLGGWQSGFVTASGRRKPAFAVFRSLR